MLDAASASWIALVLGLIAIAGTAIAIVSRRARRCEQSLDETVERARLLEDRIAQLTRDNESLARDSDARYSVLIRSTNIGFYDWDVPSGRVEYGGCWASMLGYELSELEPNRDTWSRLSHPQDAQLVQRQMQELFARKRERVACELRMRTASGRWHWVLNQAQVIAWSPEGRPLRVLGTHVDIDDAKRAEQALQSQRRLFDAGPVILLTVDGEPPHRLQQASSNLQIARGQADKPPPLGQPLTELIHPADAAPILARAAQATGQPGVQAQREVRLSHADGSWRWHLLHLVADRPGQGTALRGYLIDIERLKQAESQAAERSHDLQELVQKMSGTQRFMQSLQQITELLQLCESEAEGGQVMSRGGPELFPRWDGGVTFVANDGSMELSARWGNFVQAEGALENDCWAVRRGRLHRAQAGSTRGLAPVCSHFGGGDVLPPGITHTICAPLMLGTERAGALHLIAREPMAEDELRTAAWGAETFADALKLSLANLRLRMSLRDQAVRDWMTGLYNRRYFDEVLQHEVSRAERTGDPLTLALFDIDHFKSFNDNYGHEAGDEVIRAVAQQLLSFVRSSDIACRVGGEELALLLPRAYLEETCVRLDRLREQISQLKLHHARIALPQITVSIGVADMSNGPGRDLLRRADVAMYASKRNGRNRLTCWDPDLAEASDFTPLDAPKLAGDVRTIRAVSTG